MYHQPKVSQRAGMVYLVGAGPGDPGLITVRGAACLRKADVAVYDYLVSTELLDYLQPGAERIFAGKLAGNHFMDQDEIIALLIRKAKEGKQVVRLKGGDPFVFGRGGEECLALADAGVPFEVVPGISAATGATVYAGIPVTHRGYASSVYLVTAHLSSKGAELNINWEHLAGVADTLCIYMGMRLIPEIAEQLQAHGCAIDTPVAVIQWGTHLKQRTLTGTLGDIAEKVRASGITRPGLIVVGDVVRLRDRLNWFERRPLFGKRIAVAGVSDHVEELMFQIRSFGADTLQLPPAEHLPPDSWKEIDSAIDNLRDYGWIGFSSPNAVRYFLGRLDQLGYDARRLGNARVCAAGKSTAHVLEECRIQPDFVTDEETGNPFALVNAPMGSLQGQRLLVPHSNLTPKWIINLRERFGENVDLITAYRLVPLVCSNTVQRDLLKERPIDWIIFTAPSAVDELLDYVQPILGVDWLRGVRLASVNPATSDRIRECELEPSLEVCAENTSALLDKILNHDARRANVLDLDAPTCGEHESTLSSTV